MASNNGCPEELIEEGKRLYIQMTQFGHISSPMVSTTEEEFYSFVKKYLDWGNVWIDPGAIYRHTHQYKRMNIHDGLAEDFHIFNLGGYKREILMQ